jgi:hypothetical protein
MNMNEAPQIAAKDNSSVRYALIPRGYRGPPGPQLHSHP